MNGLEEEESVLLTAPEWNANSNCTHGASEAISRSRMRRRPTALTRSMLDLSRTQSWIRLPRGRTDMTGKEGKLIRALRAFQKGGEVTRAGDFVVLVQFFSDKAKDEEGPAPV